MRRVKVKESGSSMSSESDRQLNAISLEYSFEELRGSTDNFSVSNRVGQGAYGDVYKGVLRDGNEVAIKYLHADQQAAGFEEEVKVLSKFRHQNLVILMGFSRHGAQRLLVYELLPGGDVGSRLQKGPPLPWRQRLNIALDAACGLSHLHNQNPKVFHRDIKSANILLDRNGTAKWGDFGLACLSAKLSHKVLQTAGTVGYADPKYISTSVVTENTEVYSYGWVIIELLTAKPPAVQHRDGRISYFLSKLKDPKTGVPSLRNLLAFVDESAVFPEAVRMALAKLALRSVSPDESNRPDFRSIVLELRRLVADCDLMYGHRGQDQGDRFLCAPSGGYEHPSFVGHGKQLAPPLAGFQQKTFNHVTPSPHGTLARSLVGQAEHRNLQIPETHLPFGSASEERRPQPNWHNQSRTTTNAARPPFESLLPQLTNPSFVPSSPAVPQDSSKAGQKQLSPPIYQTPRPNKVSYGYNASPQPTMSRGQGNTPGEEHRVYPASQRHAPLDFNEQQPLPTVAPEVHRATVGERGDLAMNVRMLRPTMPPTTSSSSSSSATPFQATSQPSDDGQVYQDAELQRKISVPCHVSRATNGADATDLRQPSSNSPGSPQSPNQSRSETTYAKPQAPVPEAHTSPSRCSAQDEAGRKISQMTHMHRYVTIPDARTFDQIVQGEAGASPRKLTSFTAQPTRVSQVVTASTSHVIPSKVDSATAGRAPVPASIELPSDAGNNMARAEAQQSAEKVGRLAEDTFGSPLSSYRAGNSQTPSGCRPASPETSSTPNANAAAGVPQAAAGRGIERKAKSTGSSTRSEQVAPHNGSTTSRARKAPATEEASQNVGCVVSEAASRSKSAFSKQRPQTCVHASSLAEQGFQGQSMPRSRIGDNIYHHTRTRSSSRHGGESDFSAPTLSQLSLNGSERSVSTPVFGIEEELEQFHNDRGSDSMDDLRAGPRFGSATSRATVTRRPTRDLPSKMIAELQRAKAACRGVATPSKKSVRSETTSGQSGFRTARAYAQPQRDNPDWNSSFQAEKNRTKCPATRHQLPETIRTVRQGRNPPSPRITHDDRSKGVPRSELASLHGGRQNVARTGSPNTLVQNSWSDPASDSVTSPQESYRRTRETAPEKVGTAFSAATGAITERSRRHQAARAASRSQDQASVLATSRRRCSHEVGEVSLPKPMAISMSRTYTGNCRSAGSRAVTDDTSRSARPVDFLDSASSDMSGDIVQSLKASVGEIAAPSPVKKAPSNYSPQSDRYLLSPEKPVSTAGITRESRAPSDKLLEPSSLHFKPQHTSGTVRASGAAYVRDDIHARSNLSNWAEIPLSEKFKSFGQAESVPAMQPFESNHHSLGIFSTATDLVPSAMSPGNALMGSGLGLIGCESAVAGSENGYMKFVSGPSAAPCSTTGLASHSSDTEGSRRGSLVSSRTENDRNETLERYRREAEHQLHHPDLDDRHPDSEHDNNSSLGLEVNDEPDGRLSELETTTTGQPCGSPMSNPFMVSPNHDQISVLATSVLRDSYLELPAKPWNGRAPWIGTSSTLDSKPYGAELKPYGTSSALECKPYGTALNSRPYCTSSGLEQKPYRSGLSWGACSTNSGVSLSGMSPSSLSSSVSSVFGNNSTEMTGGLCAMMTEATLSMPSCMGAPLERPLA